MPNLQAGTTKIRAGDVIRVTAYFTQPPKPKILICVCPVRFKYLVVNTEPFRLATAAQLQVKKSELPVLDHTSHIDTSKLVTLDAMQTQNVVDADAKCHKGPLPAVLRQAIKELIEKHGIMPNDQMALVAANL